MSRYPVTAQKPSVSFIRVTRRKDFSSCCPQKTCQYCLSLVCSTAGHGSICRTGRSLVGKHTHVATVVSLEVDRMRLWLLSHTKCDQSVVGNKRLGLGLSAEMTEPRNLTQTSRIGSNDPRNDVASRMIWLFPPLPDLTGTAMQRKYLAFYICQKESGDHIWPLLGIWSAHSHLKRPEKKTIRPCWSSWPDCCISVHLSRPFFWSPFSPMKKCF